MRVKAQLYTYREQISNGVPTKTRVLIQTFPALLFPVSVTEKSSVLSTFGVVDYRLYPLAPVAVQVNDEIEINGKVYQITHVALSPTKYITSVIYLRGDDSGG
ncbi:MAG: hypothetical protein QXY94_06865 [Archaeoglobaceae archaeon]